MARNSQRQSKIAEKARQSQEQTAERKQLEAKLAEEVESRRQSSVRTREISARLKLVKNSAKKLPATLVASSSGRVKTMTPRTASSKSACAANVPIDVPEPEPPLSNSAGHDDPHHYNDLLQAIVHFPTIRGKPK
ncbi:hypothetical protein B0H14DRAFT_2575618 [Mycena olivaceomarginata]|nr:hypothetical protein B0H14DRAFT_2575618 [Mycena olivaceomarginata]